MGRTQPSTIRSCRSPAPVAVLLMFGTTFAMASCGTGSDPVPTASGTAPNAVVEHVVDGDTVVVRTGGVEERVRLIGIDTPESVKPGTEVECFAEEASQRTGDLLPEGTEVLLERDVEVRDRYDRLLAYVYRSSDGLFVNEALVIDGYAQPATYPPNLAHNERLMQAGREARETQRGLWGTCGGDDLYG